MRFEGWSTDISAGADEYRRSGQDILLNECMVPGKSILPNSDGEIGGGGKKDTPGDLNKVGELSSRWLRPLVAVRLRFRYRMDVRFPRDGR